MKTFKRRSGKRVDPGQKVAAARSRVDRASLRLRSAIAEALDCVSPTVSVSRGGWPTKPDDAAETCGSPKYPGEIKLSQ